jgi:hypothetical protein
MKSFAQRIRRQSRRKKYQQRQQEQTITTRSAPDNETEMRNLLKQAPAPLFQQRILVTSGRNATNQAVV